MACGSCGQRYNQDSLYTVVGSGGGSSQGVIKKAEVERRALEVERKLAAIKKGKETSPPLSPNPVAGQSGPANEPE